MFYLTYVLVGIFTVITWSILFYLVKPSAFFIVENNQTLSRWKILLHWFLITLIVFIIFCLIVPSEQTLKEHDAPISVLFLGMIATFIGLFLLGKNKINIDKNKKASEQLKEDWKKLKQDWDKEKPQKEVQINEENKHVKLKEEVISDKEQPIYISSTEAIYQPSNQIVNFEKDDCEILDNLDLAGFRYVLNYKDRHGNVSVRGVDITGVHKEYGNNRWYFIADTIDGERTFKSQRVISLEDQWFSQKYETAKSIREHLLSEYDVIEDIEE
ncbi:hypothetical protein APC81_06485 [Acinetobacter baumannii]|nr:hypothetical protein APC81_06485 [Acinetobacter baumannii]